MKKGLSILLVFTVLLFMFACGKDITESAPANSGTTGESQGEITADNTESTTLLCSVPTKPPEK